MRLNAFAVALLLATNSLVWASEDILNRADALIRLQSPEQAYELLAPLEDELAGTPQFDYLLGLSLLEQNKPQNAIFAFERCLTVEPTNGPCRVQMARTHLALGEASNARAEFEIINEYNPPAEINDIVRGYLNAIQNLEKTQKRHLALYSQIGMGFDTNINSAPSSTNTIANTATSLDSAYISLNLGSKLLYKINPYLTSLTNINIQSRKFDKSLPDDNSPYTTDIFDYQSIDANFSIQSDLESFELITQLQAQQMWLNEEEYRSIKGGLLQLQTEIANGQASIFRQINTLNYDKLSTRDTKRNNTGMIYYKDIETRFTPSLFLSVYKGQEEAESNLTQYLTNSFKGIAVGSSLNITNDISLNIRMSQEKRYHNKQLFPIINIYRGDTENSMNISTNWRINKHFSLIPSYNYSDNQSNIAFSDFTRHVISIDLRVDM